MFSTYNWSNSQIIIYEPCDSKDLMYIIKKQPSVAASSFNKSFNFSVSSKN